MKTQNYYRFSLITILTISCFVIIPNTIVSQTLEEQIAKYTAGLPFPFPGVTIPKFPDKNYNIIEYGAVADGLTVNTLSINKAISECSEKGGGHVIVPSGLWITGAIEMKNNVDLHLEKGAMVVFSADHRDFPLLQKGKNSYEVMNPLYGRNLENISISGDGIFDGNGQTWRPVKKSKLTDSQWRHLVASGGVVTERGDMWWPNEESMNAEKYLSSKRKNELTESDFEHVRDFLRPYQLCLEDCKNILLDEITLQNSPKFAMNLRRCESVIVRNVKVMNEWWTQNGDGLDLSACKNVVMFGCTVNAGDDGICIKSSGEPAGSPAMENIIIADCSVYHAHGGFVIGSNTDGGIKNVSVKNCNFTWSDVGLRFKSGIGRGGLVQNIFIDGIHMKDIESEAILFDMFYADAAAVKMKDDKIEDSKSPRFQNFYIKNVICDGANTAFLCRGLNYESVKNIELSNVLIKSRNGFYADMLNGIKLSNVKILNSKQPAFNLNQVENFTCDPTYISEQADNFIKISGNGTKNIKFLNPNAQITAQKIDISGEVDTSQIVIK